MSNEIQFLLYNLPDKEGRVQVVIKDETIWCTQKAMAQLFGVGVLFLPCARRVHVLKGESPEGVHREAESEGSRILKI